jgi:hypothetical protein
MIGTWVPYKRGYQKTCPVCEMEFIGRRNKIYCSPTCKNQHHNDANREIRAEERLMSKSLIRNERVLSKLFEETNDKRRTVSAEELRFRGFDMKGQNTEIKDKSGNTWYKVHQHAFRPVENAKSIIVVKLK